MPAKRKCLTDIKMANIKSLDLQLLCCDYISFISRNIVLEAVWFR